MTSSGILTGPEGIVLQKQKPYHSTKSETLTIVSYGSKPISSSLEKRFRECSSRVIVRRATIDAETLLVPEMSRYMLRVR